MYRRVYVEITNVCNKNCSFCHGTKRPPKFMTMAEFNLVTDKLVGLTNYIYLHVLGEPLCHPQIFEFISLATKKGFKVAVTTNGSLLKDKGQSLINSGVYKVNISLHSFEDGLKSEYDDYINSCINFAKKSSDSGVLTVFRLWNNGFDGGRNEDVVNRLKQQISGEWKDGNRGIRIKNRLHLEYGERFEWPDINATYIGDEVFCYGLRDHFGILSDGTVVPCCLDSDGVINLGNAFSCGLDEILNSNRAKAIYDGFTSRRAEESLCKHCGYAQRFSL